MTVSIVILAAGASKRMVGKNKLLLEYNDRSIISHVCRTVLRTNLSPIIVVTGFEHKKVEKELPIKIISIGRNIHWEKGMASSVNIGISSLPKDIDGSMILLGDMPLIKSSTLRLLIEKFDYYHGRNIIYPIYEERQGNPVIFPKKYFNEILNGDGDRGCKKVLRRYPSDAIGIPIESDEVVLDCDTQDDYFLIKSRKS